MSDPRVPWLDAMFGVIYNNGVPLDKQLGGLDCVEGVAARVNEATGRIEIYRGGSSPVDSYSEAAVDALIADFVTGAAVDALIADFVTGAAVDALIADFVTGADLDNLNASLLRLTGADPAFQLGASGPKIYSGIGAPSASDAAGSLYLRTTGRLYIRDAGAWTEIPAFVPADYVSVSGLQSLPDCQTQIGQSIGMGGAPVRGYTWIMDSEALVVDVPIPTSATGVVDVRIVVRDGSGLHHYQGRLVAENLAGAPMIPHALSAIVDDLTALGVTVVAAVSSANIRLTITNGTGSPVTARALAVPSWMSVPAALYIPPPPPL